MSARGERSSILRPLPPPPEAPQAAAQLHVLPLLLGPRPGTLPLVNMECPQQANGFDCGVYVLAFAEILALAPPGDIGKAPSAALKEALHALRPEGITAKRAAWHAELMAAVEQGSRG